MSYKHNHESHYADNTDKIRQVLAKIKAEAGSHSPSVTTLLQELPQVKIKIDACFLSNPYATDLFLQYFTQEVMGTERLRRMIEYYPSQNRAVASRLASRLALPPERIFLGNGATEIIQAIIHNFCAGKLLINLPTFSPYYEFVRPNTQVIYNHLSKETQFKLDVDAYLALVRKEKPDMVVLINPNNPDGSYLAAAELRALLHELRAVNHVIVDESFVHFAFEDAALSLLSFADLTQEFSNLIVIKSMSKDFGIAGIRVGYAVMSASKVSQLLSNGFLWNISGLAEYFFDLWVRADFFAQYNQARIRYIHETQTFIAALAQISGLQIYPSKANYVLVELINGLSAFDFVSELLIRNGIYTRNCDDKKGLVGEFVRIGARSAEENEQIRQAIQTLCTEVDLRAMTPTPLPLAHK